MARYAIPFVLTLIVLASTVPAGAQQMEPGSASLVAADQLIAAAVVEEAGTAAAAQQTGAPATFAPVFTSPKAPAWFMGVHAVTAGLQILDGYSTVKSMRNGAYEANPLFAPLASNRPALWATKAAVAAGVIVATNSIAKRHRVAALVTAIAVNGAYATIVAHNYRVARTAPPR